SSAFRTPRSAFRVAPAAFLSVVLTAVPIPVVTAEQAGQVLCVAEAVLNDRRSVGVVQDVVLEPPVVAEDVVHQPAQEGDIAAGANVDEDVAQRRSAR